MMNAIELALRSLPRGADTNINGVYVYRTTALGCHIHTARPGGKYLVHDTIDSAIAELARR